MIPAVDGVREVTKGSKTTSLKYLVRVECRGDSVVRDESVAGNNSSVEGGSAIGSGYVAGGWSSVDPRRGFFLKLPSGHPFFLTSFPPTSRSGIFIEWAVFGRPPDTPEDSFP